MGGNRTLGIFGEKVLPSLRQLRASLSSSRYHSASPPTPKVEMYGGGETFTHSGSLSNAQWRQKSSSRFIRASSKTLGNIFYSLRISPYLTGTGASTGSHGNEEIVGCNPLWIKSKRSRIVSFPRLTRTSIILVQVVRFISNSVFHLHRRSM